jgi:hypothetical protein
MWLLFGFMMSVSSELPAIGMVKFRDAETGSFQWVDSSSAKVRESYSRWWKEHDQLLDTAFTKTGVDYVNINTRQDYVKSLMTLFKKRASLK